MHSEFVSEETSEPCERGRGGVGWGGDGLSPNYLLLACRHVDGQADNMKDIKTGRETN